MAFGRKACERVVVVGAARRSRGWPPACVRVGVGGYARTRALVCVYLKMLVVILLLLLLRGCSDVSMATGLDRVVVTGGRVAGVVVVRSCRRGRRFSVTCRRLWSSPPARPTTAYAYLRRRWWRERARVRAWYFIYTRVPTPLCNNNVRPVAYARTVTHARNGAVVGWLCNNNGPKFLSNILLFYCNGCDVFFILARAERLLTPPAPNVRKPANSKRPFRLLYRIIIY